MTVTKTSSDAGIPVWVHLAGTIQEVLDALASERASALNVPYWSDDGTDAKAIFCRQE